MDKNQNNLKAAKTFFMEYFNLYLKI